MRTWPSCRRRTASCGRCGSAVTARSRRPGAMRARSRCSCAGVPVLGTDGRVGWSTWVVHDLAAARRTASLRRRGRPRRGWCWPGRGSRRSARARRVNGVLTAVRGMVVHAVAAGQAPGIWCRCSMRWPMTGTCLEQARDDEGRMGWRMRARHRLHEPETPVDRASDAEIVALLTACRSARDRLIVLLMARAGLRRGEVCGLRRSDVHLLVDSRPLGCELPARTCTWCAARTTRTGRGPSPGGSARCRWTSSRCRRSTPTSSSGCAFPGPLAATSSWSTCSASRSARRCARTRSAS